MPYPAKLNAETILAAALTLLRESGLDALSMRPLAGRLGVRPSSLYRYYPERDALLAALETHATTELHAEVQAAVQGKDPHAAFVAAGEAYLGYARREPQLYALLLRDGQVYTAKPGGGKALWDEVLALVGAVTSNPDDTAATVAFWSFLHGFIALERAGRFGPSGPKGGFERGLRALLRGLGDSAAS